MKKHKPTAKKIFPKVPEQPTDEELCTAARKSMMLLNSCLRTLAARSVSPEIAQGTKDGGPYELFLTKLL